MIYIVLCSHIEIFEILYSQCKILYFFVMFYEVIVRQPLGTPVTDNLCRYDKLHLSGILLFSTLYYDVL